MASIRNSLKKINEALGGTNDKNEHWRSLIDEIAKNATSGGGGGSNLPEVTNDDNGNVLTVVNGTWDKAAPQGGEDPGYEITRNRYYFLQNEDIELVSGDISLFETSYQFTGLQRQTDVIIPGENSNEVCYIRIPDEFIQGMYKHEVTVGLIFNSVPAPSNVHGVAYMAEVLDKGVVPNIEATVMFESPDKAPFSVYTRHAGAFALGSLTYLDNNSGLVDPEDFGWYYAVWRTSKFLRVGQQHQGYDSDIPETAQVTFYLEMVHVEIDPDLEKAITNETQNTLNPMTTICFDPGNDTGVPAWFFDGRDPFEINPPVWDGTYKWESPTIPALLNPIVYYQEYGSYENPYDLACTPISGSITINFAVDEDGTYLNDVVNIDGKFATLVYESFWEDATVTIRSVSLDIFTVWQAIEYDDETYEPIRGPLSVYKDMSIDLTSLATAGEELTPVPSQDNDM